MFIEKPYAMKTSIKKAAILQLLFLSLMGCAPTPPESMAFETNNTPFQQLSDSLLVSPEYKSQITYDTEVHEYTFVMHRSGNICCIGYQSLPTITGIPYTIELVNRENKVLFSGNYTFTAGNLKYVEAQQIRITANEPYTLRRIMLLQEAGNNSDNLMGRTIIKKNKTMTFPVRFGNMTIIGSNFYQNGGPLQNAGIPFIDFVFTEI